MEQAYQAAAAETAGRRLGATVRGIRTARGTTLAELGKRTGYSVAQVSRLERGIVPLTDIAVLRRFASALEVAPETLGLAPGQVPGEQQRPRAQPGAELVRPYADRGLVTRQQWNGLAAEPGTWDGTLGSLVSVTSELGSSGAGCVAVVQPGSVAEIVPWPCMVTGGGGFTAGARAAASGGGLEQAANATMAAKVTPTPPPGTKPKRLTRPRIG